MSDIVFMSHDYTVARRIVTSKSRDVSQLSDRRLIQAMKGCEEMRVGKVGPRRARIDEVHNLVIDEMERRGIDWENA